MDYVVFHATIDTQGRRASLEFYIKHSDGTPVSSDAERQRVVQCIQAAIQRKASQVGETLLKIAVEGFFPTTLSDDLPENESKEHTDQGDIVSDPSMIHEKTLSSALCTPSVRNLAKELGINVNNIKGKGKDGRVLKEDVLNYVGGKEFNHLPSNFAHSEQSVSESLHFEDKVLPMRGYQRAMVKAMSMAASIPHFHYVEEVNCDALLKLKSSFQSENSDPSIKHTFLPFLVKSLSMALSKYPLLNSSFNQDKHEIIIKGPHNIGVAMATPYGLVVPNIKRVQSLSILEVMPSTIAAECFTVT